MVYPFILFFHGGSNVFISSLIWLINLLLLFEFEFEQVEIDQRAQDCLLPMGITSENVAERYGVGRKQQDTAAVS